MRKAAEEKLWAQMDKHIKAWKPTFQQWKEHAKQVLKRPDQEFHDVMQEIVETLRKQGAPRHVTTSWEKEWTHVAEEFLQRWKACTTKGKQH